MRIVNLFAGHQTWLKPWREAGHETWASDILDISGIDVAGDILDLNANDVPWKPDVVCASPDCTAFSVASIGTHWGGGHRAYLPLTDKARNRIALVEKTKELLAAWQPKYFIIENPRGMLRKLGLLDDFERRTVWYCHYDESDRAKPTDLWGGFPSQFKTEPICHNQRREHPLDCCCRDHASAPRGAKTGTQGREKAARSFIPYALTDSFMQAVVAAEVQASL